MVGNHQLYSPGACPVEERHSRCDVLFPPIVGVSRIIWRRSNNRDAGQIEPHQPLQNDSDVGWQIPQTEPIHTKQHSQVYRQYCQ